MSLCKGRMDMEFETSIDSAVLAGALCAKLDEDAAAHPRGSFREIATGEGIATVMVHEAMHPQKSLLADVTWEAQEGGSHVAVSYRVPQAEETESVGFLAPLAAYLTMMLLVGGAMWGVGFGLLWLILQENRGAAWLFAFIAPVVYLTYVLIGSMTARTRARRRFEKLMRDMLAE